MISRAAETTAVSPLLLGWLVAVAIHSRRDRPLSPPSPQPALWLHSPQPWIVRARPCWHLGIGSGSLFFSHVNDAGFWMVKEVLRALSRRDAEDVVRDGDPHQRCRAGRRDGTARLCNTAEAALRLTSSSSGCWYSTFIGGPTWT